LQWRNEATREESWVETTETDGEEEIYTVTVFYHHRRHEIPKDKHDAKHRHPKRLPQVLDPNITLKARVRQIHTLC